jgi:hypothetical protein
MVQTRYQRKLKEVVQQVQDLVEAGKPLHAYEV